MKRLSASIAVTCTLLIAPPLPSAGLPRPSKPPLTEDVGRTEDGKSRIKCKSRTLTLGGKAINYRFPREGNLVAITDRTVEWHMFGPEPDDYHYVVQMENREGGSLACTAIARSGNWVGVGRKDGGVALHRFTARPEGPKRFLAKTGFSALKNCELRELGKGEKPGKSEQLVRISTDYDDQPVRLAVKKTE
jgi:hypothetical protein